MSDIELSIVMPCLNEAETIAICINKAKDFLEKEQVVGEVIIADNGSTDGSLEIADSLGARIVHIERKGYGAALQGGIKAARGKYVIMGDSDDSYDFSNLLPFLTELRNGTQLVMGNRFKGGIEEGAMPFLHRYLGNPVLSFVGRLFFNIPVGDFHCGLRGFSKPAFDLMELTAPGMEFASEMVVKSSLKKLSIAEVPTILSPDGRTRPPHLRTWRDGWRHLRFLLLFAPNWLFLYPGLLVTILSLIMGVVLLLGPLTLSFATLSVHTLIYLAFTFLIGIQLVFFYYFSLIYAVTHNLLPAPNGFYKTFDYFQLETGLVLGAIITIIGLTLSVTNLISWNQAQFGPLDPNDFIRRIIPSAVCLFLGIQIILYSFIFSILGLKKDRL